jgi:rod shape-determining protein MreD
MGNFLSIPILIIAAALQASLIPQIRILSGGPDLVFLLVLAWAINSKLEDGVVWAFAGGIMLDLLSYNPTGTSVLGLLLLVFAISGLGQQVYRIGFITLVGLVLVGTLIHQLVIMLVLSLDGYPIDWTLSLSEVVAPTAFYNLILIWPIYWAVRRLQSRLDWSK